MKKACAYLQTIIKKPVNLQKDQLKTVAGVCEDKVLTSHKGQTTYRGTDRGKT